MNYMYKIQNIWLLLSLVRSLFLYILWRSWAFVAIFLTKSSKDIQSILVALFHISITIYTIENETFTRTYCIAFQSLKHSEMYKYLCDVIIVCSKKIGMYWIFWIYKINGIHLFFQPRWRYQTIFFDWEFLKLEQLLLLLRSAVAILFAAVSNQEKLVTPRLAATFGTKSTP